MRKQCAKDIEGSFLKPGFTYLVKNGLENTSVRELCKVMDLSYGSINYWFDGKDDIYISVVKYGTEKVVEALLDTALEHVENPKEFFDIYLSELDKYLLELRLIFQVTSSPVYGERMREKAKDFIPKYEECIEKIANALKCPAELVSPFIFMIVAITSDYVVWEDKPTAQLQLDFLYNQLAESLNK